MTCADYLNLPRYPIEQIAAAPVGPGVVLFFERPHKLWDTRAAPSIFALILSIRDLPGHPLRIGALEYAFLECPIDEASKRQDWINAHCHPTART